MEAREVQLLLNRFREVRQYPLRSIPVTGEMDAATHDAIRSFQHEHNDFSGSRELVESGRMDKATIHAFAWWEEFALGSYAEC